MIIETAYGLFKEKDYEKVTLNEICAACSITKTTFYYHFTSKEEIISDFYESVTVSLAEQLINVLSAENYWEQFMAIFDTLIDASEQVGPDLLGQLFIANLRADKGTFDFNDDLTKMAVMILERAQKAGEIRNTSDPLALYSAASHAFEGYEVMWCIKNGSYDRKTVLRSAFEEIFDVTPALRKDPAQNTQ